MQSYGSTEAQVETLSVDSSQIEDGASWARKEPMLSEDDERDLRFERFAPYVAEFVGTMMFAFTYGCCQLTGNPMFNPTAMASILTVCIYSFSPISGGHFNPAVTLTAAFSNKISWTKAMHYLAIQAVAGIFAAGICAWIFTVQYVVGPTNLTVQEVQNESSGIDVNSTVTEALANNIKAVIGGASAHYTLLDMAIVEFIFTTMLCFVHANCIMSKRNNQEEDPNHFYGAAVGFTMIAAGHSAQHISGAFVNPAVTMGMNFTSLAATGWVGVIFVCAQVLASMAAAALFTQVRPEDFDDFINFTGTFLPPILTRLAAEFIGTFLLVFVVGLCCTNRCGATAWAGFAAMMSLSYSLNDVSGAHFNPAVSLALVLSRRSKMSIDEFLEYSLTQVGAGMCAGLLFGHYKYVGMFSKTTFIVHYEVGYTLFEAAIAETSMACLLAFTFLACATITMPPSVTRTNFYFGISIGGTIAAAGFAIGAVTGAVLNPALSAGISTAYLYSPGDGKMLGPPPGHAFIGRARRLEEKVHNIDGAWPLTNAAMFSSFQLAGGLLAACIFYVSHQREYMKKIGFPVSTVASQGLT